MKNSLFSFNDIPLVIPEKFTPEKNSFTILVGNNGVGKSRLLDALSRSLIIETTHTMAHDESLTAPNIEIRTSRNSNKYAGLFLEGIKLFPTRYIDEANNWPRVIAVSTSPFDSFKIPTKQYSDRRIHSSNYRYVGMRNSLSSSASISLINSASSGLLEKLENPESFDRLAKVFEILEFNPSLEFSFKPTFRESTKSTLDASGSESININLIDSDARVAHIEDKLNIKIDPKSYESLRFLTDETLQDIRISILTTSNIFHEKKHFKLKASYNSTWNYNFDGEFENNSQILDSIRVLLKYGLIKLMDLKLSKPSNPEISLRRASSGEQCMLVIMLGIAGHITDGSYIFIDEPEISLHPKWQEKFMTLLIEVFSTYSACRFYIATHSPQIISKLSAENCFITSLTKKDIYDAAEYKDRSADFQLAELFEAPGSMNEYLIRMAFGLISKMKSSRTVTEKDNNEIKKLLSFSEKLEQEDPLSELIKTVLEMNRYYATNK